MSLFATEKLPQPLVMDGIVRNDVGTRTLTVSRPDQASGYQKVAWRLAHEALRASEQSGWRGAPFLWASGAGQTEIAHGLPGDNVTVSFPGWQDAYRQLVSKPGLSAFVVVDKSTSWFTSVRFHHLSRP